MTREETIKWLESLKAEIGKSEHRTLWHYAEAIDMAIEALQTEGVGRYENAMQKLREIPRYFNGVKEKQKVKRVKHGEWVLGDGYYCSSCGYKLQTTAILRYCPNCGAKMGRKDDE